AAIIDTNRTLVGSPRALNIRANCCASSTVSTPPVTGTQHPSASVAISGSEVVMSSTLRHALTTVDASTSINLKSGYARDMEQAMSENENTELREQVRARYAQAATAVTTGTRNAALLTEETPVSSCCSSTTAAEGTEPDSGSCCAPTERSFGAGLYDE